MHATTIRIQSNVSELRNHPASMLQRKVSAIIVRNQPMRGEYVEERSSRSPCQKARVMKKRTIATPTSPNCSANSNTPFSAYPMPGQLSTTLMRWDSRLPGNQKPPKPYPNHGRFKIDSHTS